MPDPSATPSTKPSIDPLGPKLVSLASEVWLAFHEDDRSWGTAGAREKWARKYTTEQAEKCGCLKCRLWMRGEVNP